MVQVTMEQAVTMVVNMVLMIHMVVMALITIPLYLSVLPTIPQVVTMQMLGLKHLVRLTVECMILVLSTSVSLVTQSNALTRVLNTYPSQMANSIDPTVATVIKTIFNLYYCT